MKRGSVNAERVAEGVLGNRKIAIGEIEDDVAADGVAEQSLDAMPHAFQALAKAQAVKGGKPGGL